MPPNYKRCMCARARTSVSTNVRACDSRAQVFNFELYKYLKTRGLLKYV